MMATLLKFVHIPAIAVWAAGLICLPFLNRQRERVRTETELHRLHSMVRFFYVVIVSPAAFIAIASGTALIFAQHTFTLWFSLKLLLVGLLVGIHMRIGHVILRVFDRPSGWPAWRHRAMTIVAASTALSVIAVVLIKPALHLQVFASDRFAPGSLGAVFDRKAHANRDDGAFASLARIDHQTDAMIEYQFAAMPTGKPGEDRSQQRQPEPVRQHLLRGSEPQAPVRTGDREQRHRCDRVRPATDTIANTLHCQQLGRSKERGEKPEPEREARAPDSSAQKERIAEEPIEHIDPQGGEH